MWSCIQSAATIWRLGKLFAQLRILKFEIVIVTLQLLHCVPKGFDLHVKLGGLIL